MTTRREWLLGFVAANSAAAIGVQKIQQPSADLQILSEPHTLSVESRDGFQLLIRQFRPNITRPLIIASGFAHLSIEYACDLRCRVLSGATLLFENGEAFSHSRPGRSQTEVLATAFGLHVFRSSYASSLCPYVRYRAPRYRAPIDARVRLFGEPVSADCPQEESLAEHAGKTVCVQRTLGAGQFIYLGSMLGPLLYAEDREALALGTALLWQQLTRS